MKLPKLKLGRAEDALPPAPLPLHSELSLGGSPPRALSAPVLLLFFLPALLLLKKFKSKPSTWQLFRAKMEAEGLDAVAIRAFKYNFDKLTSGESLLLPESSITPVNELPSYATLTEEDPSFLKCTVLLKLNGGIGTGMGLEKAKSLLPVRDGITFLDFIARQVLYMRRKFGVELAFMLMNSFSTSEDTLAALAKYDTLAADLPLEFLQNKAPKIVKETLTPAEYSENPALEWCPPGHGDLYTALLGSGTLDTLLAKGFKYMFVSNSDNLGATMDVKLLTWFAKSGAPFAMEVALRTAADKKGGHLARGPSGGLLLRELAQCPDEDADAFQDVSKHKFFNTNNLWVNLEALKTTLLKFDGVMPLPVISNGKTVNPRDKKSTKVLQLETAMGSAIECFERAQAILIPRSRFAPVKTTADLLALSSDAYEITPDSRLVLKPERKGVPPTVKLDDCFKFVDQLAQLTRGGVPSLIKCEKLTVEGKVTFAAGVVIDGTVKFVNTGEEFALVQGKTYKDQTVQFS
ncbi:hypothetical protein AB1Y20_019227 [Prymnesium parvum]|uniref:UTP--glucose-1-phosphate uridylyltransferase n=1 Tax=Prymnesium parvum TaxID=97485 RepID=A0AB34JU16_PRYPA